MTTDEAQLPPLVAHIIYRFSVGGLENGLINLLNQMPADRYRHVIICLTDYSDFRHRLTRDDVEIIALHKRPGHDLRMMWRLFRLLRRLRPALVHTRNLAALDAILPARLAGVRHCVHGEHGRDAMDLRGVNRTYIRLRRMLMPWIDRFVCVSQDIEQWLLNAVEVPRERVVQIYNGVDSERFMPADARQPLPDQGSEATDHCVIGTIGRMSPEKNTLCLVRAFILLLTRHPTWRNQLRLALVGDGPLREQVVAELAQADLLDRVWLPGSRNDTPDIYRGLDVFVLPSHIEGISNTILEAMASGLPVLATAVGGNPELVTEGETGSLVPDDDVEAMAERLVGYCNDVVSRQHHGQHARARVVRQFSMDSMVNNYMAVYDAVLGRS